MDFDEEIWRRVKFVEGYSISSKGRVKDHNRDSILISTRNRETHEPWVSFTRDEMSFKGPIWFLMVQSFLDLANPRTVYPDYRDGDPSNLDIFNIRWSDKDGIPVMFRITEAGDWKRIRHAARQVMIVETGVVYDSVPVCATAIGGSANTIWMCLRGAQRSHHGYTFLYVS